MNLTLAYDDERLCLFLLLTFVFVYFCSNDPSILTTSVQIVNASVTFRNLALIHSGYKFWFHSTAVSPIVSRPLQVKCIVTIVKFLIDVSVISSKLDPTYYQ